MHSSKYNDLIKSLLVQAS